MHAISKGFVHVKQKNEITRIDRYTKLLLLKQNNAEIL